VFIKPKKLRWKDVLLTAESAGADAFGIISLVGFLLGLILAYQSVHSLKDFGAEIYVADIVSLSLFRELGPLMTAIVLAGRSGSAFAAEIGTMKVNEEIDALTTMGLDPVRFLALPRIIAAVIVTPLLSLFSCLFGLVGAGLVMLIRGFPVLTYLTQVRDAVDVVDLSGGLVKAFVFGVLIASIGCLRGLQTKLGARSVGISATRAVVSGIVLIVIADGIFAVVYNLLEI
jgi:phospholipid/cholesterol/gamma-HCH transport system permease protein